MINKSKWLISCGMVGVFAMALLLAGPIPVALADNGMGYLSVAEQEPTLANVPQPNNPKRHHECRHKTDKNGNVIWCARNCVMPNGDPGRCVREKVGSTLRCHCEPLGIA